ncbi:uncharacterized protein BKCO1_4800042 [Diplodia corticola]|uniref:Uncharacterized protein n=1 Tax=Diplodia corticola TaxID=236234 RepID=A0A1J9RVD4_9PEZI|nr:uncharacterized protein BKCO1_4800042 [Diplodia corticola]OJD31461.1 hypothetical protein BKCO1_4800042 [Diplodia corticola]
MEPIQTDIIDMAFLKNRRFGGFVPSNAYYFMNTTTASPATATVVPDPTCLSNCSFAARKAVPWVWKKIKPTATITHAVVYHIVNNRTNTTSLSTSYLAQNGTDTYSPPMTNSAGTKVVEITLVAPSETGVTSVATVTYPSIFTSYNSGYRWWGVLPTTTAGGQSVCSWVPWWVSSTALNTTTTVPIYTTMPNGAVTRSSIASLAPVSFATMAVGDFVTYTSINHFGEQPEPDPEDPEGLWYVPVRDVEKQELGVPSNIEDAAVQQCFHDEYYDAALVGELGPKELSTALFLTLTETIHEGVSDPPEASIPSMVEVTMEPPVPDIITSEVKTTAVGTVLPGSTTKPAPSPTQSNPAATETIPVASEGGEVADNTALPVEDGQTPSTTPAKASPTAIIIGDATVSRNSNSELLIGTQILQPGIPVTLDSAKDSDGNLSPVTVILETSGGETLLAVGDTITTIPPAAPPQPSDANTVITAGDQTLSFNPSANNIVLPDGRTLSPGSTITLPGSNPSSVNKGDDDQPLTIALLPPATTTNNDNDDTTPSDPRRLVINGITTTLPVPFPAASISNPTPSTVIAVAAGATYSLTLLLLGPDPSARPTVAAILSDGRTLSPGADATSPVALLVDTDARGSPTATRLVVGTAVAVLGPAVTVAAASAAAEGGAGRTGVGGGWESDVVSVEGSGTGTGMATAREVTTTTMAMTTSGGGGGLGDAVWEGLGGTRSGAADAAATASGDGERKGGAERVRGGGGDGVQVFGLVAALGVAVRMWL